MGCVYLARNRVNNKRYVGKTTKTLSKRARQHIKPSHPTLFHKAITKYGPENFEWTVLFEGDDNKELMRVEVAMIAMLQTKMPRGYNLTHGGEGTLGYEPTAESRARMSASLMGNTHTKGHKLTAEHCAKMSASQRGIKRTLETRERMSKPKSLEMRAKLSAARRGMKFTQEHCNNIRKAKQNISPKTRAKMSVSAKKKVFTAEHRANLGAARKGIKRKPETVAKMIAAMTGRKFSAEHCANISAAKKGKKHINKEQQHGSIARAGN